MRWRILGQRVLDDDPDPKMTEALERLDDLHERAEKVAGRLRGDTFVDEVAALFRGESL